MPLPSDMINLIDQRIRAQSTRWTAAGSCVERTGDTTALVTIDGSSQPVPVKVFGHANVAEGDRVGLVRVGADWCVMGTWARRGVQSHAGISKAANVDSSVATANVPINEFGFTFWKYDHGSEIKLTLSMSCSASVGNTGVVAGIRIHSDDYGPSDFDVTQILHKSANVPIPLPAGFKYINGLFAAQYTCSVYWRRSAGTGTLNRDANDWISACAEEMAA